MFFHGIVQAPHGVLVDPWFRHNLNRTERDATATREAGVNFEYYTSSH